MTNTHKEGEKIHNKYTREVVCPHCGYEMSDSWELELEHDGDEMEVDCVDCGEPFIVSINIKITYSTFKL